MVNTLFLQHWGFSKCILTMSSWECCTGGGGVSGHGLLGTVQRALNSVHWMVYGEYREGAFPDTICWKRLRNTWFEIPGKSALWTNAGQDWNFWRTFRAIGPYQFRGKFIWTNHWSIPFPGEVHMDQCPWKFFKSFPLHWHWSMDGYSQNSVSSSFYGTDCISLRIMPLKPHPRPFRLQECAFRTSKPRSLRGWDL